MQNNVPANTPDNVEMKTLTNPNFFVLMHEVEEHLTHGWRIHPDYAPVAHFTTYEVVLRKDRVSINRVRDRIDSVLGAREEANTQKRSEAAAKAAETTKRQTQQRKSGRNVQDMMASIQGGKDAG